jgi:hypothetical protein
VVEAAVDKLALALLAGHSTQCVVYWVPAAIQLASDAGGGVPPPRGLVHRGCRGYELC